MVDVSDQPSTAEGQVVRRRTIITLGGVGVSSGVEAPSSPADAGVDAGKLPSLPRFVPGSDFVVPLLAVGTGEKKNR